MELSIVSPVYNAQNCLEQLIKKIKNNVDKLKIIKKFEIVLIDDFSNDNSWNELRRLKKKFFFLKIYHQKKNIGQHQTLRNCLKKARGDKIIILDCDLQDNPNYILKFYKSYPNEDVVIIGKLVWTSFIEKGLFSIFFWIFLSFISLKNFIGFTNYSLISRKISKKIIKKKEITFLYADLLSLNCKFKYIYYKREKRFKGESSYNFYKLFNFAKKIIFYNNYFYFILKKYFS